MISLNTIPSNTKSNRLWSSLLFCIINLWMFSASAFQVKKDTLDYWNVQKFVINQKTSQEQLDEMVQRLKKENVSLQFSNIVRNENNGYLNGIDISYKSPKSSGSYVIDPAEKFKPIAIQYDVTGKTISIAPNPTSNLSQTIELEPKRVSIPKNNDSLRTNSGTKNINLTTTSKVDTLINRAVSNRYSTESIDTLSVRAEAKDDHVSIGDESQIYVIKKVDGKVVLNDSVSRDSRGNIKWISDDGKTEDILAIENGNQIYFKDSNTRPLFVLDGEVYESDLKLIDQKNIKSVQVLKGDKALRKYGDKGKNGVIEIYRYSEISDEDYDFKLNSDLSDETEENRDDDASPKYMTLSITKNSTSRDLEHQKDYLKKINVDLEYSKIERDAVDYITRIRITLKDAQGNTASSIFNENYGIKEIYFGKDKKGLFISTTK